MQIRLEVFAQSC